MPLRDLGGGIKFHARIIMGCPKCRPPAQGIHPFFSCVPLYISHPSRTVLIRQADMVNRARSFLVPRGDTYDDWIA